MFFGFDSDGDFVPTLFKNRDKELVFYTFLVQYNSAVAQNYRIPYRYIKRSNSIKELFLNYIEDLLKPKPLKFQRAKTLCIESNLAISYYKNGGKKPLIGEPRLKVAKLIWTIFLRESFGICFSAEELFFDYVFKKVTTCNKSREIVVEDDCIYITKEDNSRLGLLVCMDKFRLKELNIKAKIQKAFLLSDEKTEIYLLFPKQQGLCRYLCIKEDNSIDAKSIKIVPYSINNRLVKGRL